MIAKVGAGRVVAGVRDPSKASDLAAQGVEVRKADFRSEPATLKAAFAGIDKVLLVSTNTLAPGGARFVEHSNAIDAAKAAGVKQLVYTSLLHADVPAVQLGEDHVATEAKLVKEATPAFSFVVLRNGWDIENYNGGIPSALQYGAVLGSSDKGRVSGAARADYADAAVAVLTADDDSVYNGKVYELAGDESFSLDEYAAALSSLTGKQIVFNNLPEADYAALLTKVGLPEFAAKILANADFNASKGFLEENSKTLSKLIGRPTTPLKTVLAAALKQ